MSYLLIVDDDATILQILGGYFRRDSRVVREASSKLEARQIFEAFGMPSVILSDLLFSGVIDEDWVAEVRGLNAMAAFVTGSPGFAPPDFPVFAKPVRLGELYDFVVRGERLTRMADQL